MPLTLASGDEFSAAAPLALPTQEDEPPPEPQEQQPPPPTPIQPLNPTDFGAFVVQILANSTRQSPVVDQPLLRQCLGLASSFLITDSTINSETGISTWSTGLTRLVDVLVALHARNELELETINSASRACSECWSAAGSWRGLEECRDGVRTVATKLKRLLDPNGLTYQGQPVYAP